MEIFLTKIFQIRIWKICCELKKTKYICTVWEKVVIHWFFSMFMQIRPSLACYNVCDKVYDRKRSVIRTWRRGLNHDVQSGICLAKIINRECKKLGFLIFDRWKIISKKFFFFYLFFTEFFSDYKKYIT